MYHFQNSIHHFQYSIHFLYVYIFSLVKILLITFVSKKYQFAMNILESDLPKDTIELQIKRKNSALMHDTRQTSTTMRVCWAKKQQQQRTCGFIFAVNWVSMGSFENICNAQIDFIAFLWLDFFFEVKCGCWSTNIYYFSTFDFARIDKKVFALQMQRTMFLMPCNFQRHPTFSSALRNGGEAIQSSEKYALIHIFIVKQNKYTNTTVDCKFSLFINTHQTGELDWIFKLRTTFSRTFFNYVQNSHFVRRLFKCKYRLIGSAVCRVILIFFILVLCKQPQATKA